MYAREDASEQIARDGDLGHLARDIAGVAHRLGALCPIVWPYRGTWANMVPPKCHRGMATGKTGWI